VTDYSDDLRDYVFSADPDVAVIDTLEFRNADFLDENGNPQAVRVANRRDDFSVMLEGDAPMNAGQNVTFFACAFEGQLPESSDQSPPTFQIAVSNAARVLMPWLDKAADSASPLYMTYRAYLSDDLSAPQFVMDGFTIKSVVAGVLQVTASAGFEDFLNSPFGKKLYTLKDNPGLDR
jgi:hypothetical protein